LKKGRTPKTIWLIIIIPGTFQSPLKERKLNRGTKPNFGIMGLKKEGKNFEENSFRTNHSKE